MSVELRNELKSDRAACVEFTAAMRAVESVCKQPSEPPAYCARPFGAFKRNCKSETRSSAPRPGRAGPWSPSKASPQQQAGHPGRHRMKGRGERPSAPLTRGAQGRARRKEAAARNSSEALQPRKGRG